ncbi:MAG: tetratricopeptide repeat protein, partial [Armatimonadota bacterium]
MPPTEHDESSDRLVEPGVTLLNEADYDGALQAFTEALQIAHKCADKATLLTCIAYTERRRGDLASAVEHYERALAINERIGPESDRT